MIQRLLLTLLILACFALAVATHAWAQADIDIAVVRAQLNTSTGNQDITTTDFGGGTPKAAIFIATKVTAVGSITGNAIGSYGATDGTNQWVTGWASNDGTSVSNAGRNEDSDEVIQMITGTSLGTLTEANFVSFITNGVRINLGAANGEAYFVTVILFGGADLSAAAGRSALATAGNVVTLSPGFETHALFTASERDTNNGTNTHITQVFGLASYDGSTIRQVASSFNEEDNEDPTETGGGIRDDAVFISMIWSSGLAGNASLENITSTSFDIRSSGDFSTLRIGWLALNLAGDGEAWAGVLDSPTATGEHSFTGVGFLPKFALVNGTMIDTVEAAKSDGTGGTWSLNPITFDTESANAWAIEDGQSAADTESVVGNLAVYQQHDDGTGAFQASFSEWLSDGLKLDFSLVNAIGGVARKWPALFITDGAVPASGSGEGQPIVIVN